MVQHRQCSPGHPTGRLCNLHQVVLCDVAPLKHKDSVQQHTHASEMCAPLSSFTLSEIKVR